MSPRSVTAVVFALLAPACADRRAPPAPPPDDMIRIPAGEFLSGCDPRQHPECSPDRPLQRRATQAFEIDRTEVPIADYIRCFDAGPCSRAAERVHAAGGPGSRRKPMPIIERDIQDLPDDRLPMYGITPEEARSYCTWAGKRLPTDLEWEKAARGTDGRPYPWGWEPPNCERAVSADCRATFLSSELKPVGSVPGGASPYGVLDMVGNVAELAEPWDGAGDGAFLMDVGVHVIVRANPLVFVLGGRGTVGRTSPGQDGKFGFRCARSVGP